MSNTQVIIRSANNGDLMKIADIEKECFSMPWSLNALREFMDLDYSWIIIAERGTEIAGYVSFSVVLDELQICNVAVTEHFRRLHIGSMLINKLIETGVEIGCTTAYLEVRKSNFPAIGLYEKCGFEIVGERKNFYASPTENAVLMNYVF